MGQVRPCGWGDPVAAIWPDRSNCQRARRRRGNVNMDFPTDSRSRRQFRQMTTAQDERERLECMVGAWRTDGRYWSESLNLKSNIHSNDDACSLGRMSSKCTSFRSSQSKVDEVAAKESAIWRSFRSADEGNRNCENIR